MPKKPALTLAPETLTACRQTGRAIRDARARRRLTQAQLAERAGCGVATLRRVEKGDPGVSYGTTMEVMAVLGRDWLGQIASMVSADPAGHELERLRLPSRVFSLSEEF